MDWLILYVLIEGAPFTQKSPLSFCQYNGSVCCNSTDDLLLKKQFEAMNVSDFPGCGSVIKSVLCSVSHLWLSIIKIVVYKMLHDL